MKHWLSILVYPVKQVSTFPKVTEHYNVFEVQGKHKFLVAWSTLLTLHVSGIVVELQVATLE